MRTFRCKCGDKIRLSSMGEGHDCEGCDICNTTFASHPDGHKPLQPHEWKIMYNQNTGKPYKRCKNCYMADAESFRESEKMIKMNNINYIGKLATIKPEVSLPDAIEKAHNYQYKIVNQNKKRTWICLESIIKLHIFGAGGFREEFVDKSFWLKVSECNINI